MTPRKIILEFVHGQDDLPGGLRPLGAYTFDPFWHSSGIFHDVFEHDFEGKNRYFKGEHAYKLAGEICAIGHIWYFSKTMDIVDRSKSPATINELKTIKPVHELIEWVAQTEAKRLPKEIITNIPDQQITCEDHKDLATPIPGYCPEYQNTIKNLLIYGYNRARRLVPNNKENRKALLDFLYGMEGIVRCTDANTLMTVYDRLEVTIYRVGSSIHVYHRLVKA
jgi:hypothetical protein